MSPESSHNPPDQEKGIPIIRVDMDKASDADYKKLKELGWVPGNPSASGEFGFSWHGEGEPALPDDLAEKVIGTKSGKFEYSVLTDKKSE